MSVQVKICGLSTARTVEASLAAGADLLGFVHFPPSPRHVDFAAAAELAAPARGRARIVGLLVDPDDSLAEAAVRLLKPDLLQLHGRESPERVAELGRRLGVPIMKAVKVATAADVRAADAYRPCCELILFDAKAPEGAAGLLPGGNGLAFDWQVLAGEAERGPFMLSGGLTPANVAEAIRLTRAPLVDVSSGVESRPGLKDPDLIRRFLAAARGCPIQ